MAHTSAGHEVSRRTFGVYGLAALGAVSAGHATSTQAAGSTATPFSNDADLVKALMKMRSSTDGSLRFGWLQAKRLSYIDGEITPLLGLLAGSVSQARDNGDGTFDITVVEITYYLDVDSGELLDTLQMPGTGKVVKIPLYRSAPTTTRVGTKTTVSEVSTGEAGVVKKGKEQGSGAFAPKGDVKLERSVGPAIVQGNSVWIQTEEYGRVFPHDPKEPRVFYKESAIWQGDLPELLDPSVHSASTNLSYSAATSWRPWMQMGDVKGHTMSSGVGGKCSDLRDMPEQWLRLTELHYPEVMKDAEGILKG